MGWRSKAEKAKKEHRPSLKDWSRDKLYKTFPSYRDAILERPHLGYEAFIPFPKLTKKRSYHYSSGSCSGDNSNSNRASAASSSSYASTTNCNLNDLNDRCTIPARIDARVTPPSEFHSRLEAKKVPTVITNIPEGFDVPPPPSTAPPALSASASVSASSSTSPSSSSSVSCNGKDKGKGNGHQSQHERNTENSNSKTMPSSSSSPNTASTITTTATATATTTIHAWKALQNWNIDKLASDPNLRERPLKCGEDDDGHSIKMKLKHFIRYLNHNTDDSPLYIFDSSFEDDKVASSIVLNDYRVPTYFNEDLFHLVGEKRRPPYRWFLIGPERSGTCVHIDPLATSAWNTLIVGKKRWVLFPPHVPKSVVKGNKLVKKGEDDEAIHYFTTILPRIKDCAVKSGGEGKYAHFECYEFTQYEGETVFIPNGWWHAVLNLTDTVGVTQNYCSQRNFDEVWVKTRTGRKKMAYKWLNKLSERYPHLAERARELNRRDGFVMKYDPEEVERRRKEEELERKERREKKEKKERKERELLEKNQYQHQHQHQHQHQYQHTGYYGHDHDHNHRQTKSISSTDASYNRDAKRSRVERVVSPELS